MAPLTNGGHYLDGGITVPVTALYTEAITAHGPRRACKGVCCLGWRNTTPGLWERSALS